MKRIDVFREFLKVIFKSTTIKPVKDKIYRSGDLFSSCEYNKSQSEKYLKLLHIAFLKDNPQIQKPSYESCDFNRKESMAHFFNYLKSYREDINCPSIEDDSANKFAYRASEIILSAIFSKLSASDKYDKDNEDISLAFREALNQIVNSQIGSNINKLLNSFKEYDKSDYFFDTEFKDGSTGYNYSLLVNLAENNAELTNLINEVKLKIYIDENNIYDAESRFFFNDVTSALNSFESSKGIVLKDNIYPGEYYLSKPLSIKNISKDFSTLINFVTYLDEEIILKKYQCTNENDLMKALNEKARNQMWDITLQLINKYELSLISYTEDLIKRVMNLNLLWIYSNNKKSVDKCKEEIEKILIGYPEIYTYFDSCSDAIITINQLLAILHNAVKEITKFINDNGHTISKCVNKHKCSEHKKYLKGKINGNKFKELKKLSEDLVQNINKAPQSLGERYYYTSSNELNEFLEAICNYYNLLKKTS